MRRALFLLSLTSCVNSKPEPTAVDAAATTQQAVGFSVEACEQVLIEAERELSTVRQSVVTECKSDSDCVLAESTACIPGCKDFAIPRSALGSYNATLAKTRGNKCKTWSDNGCPQTTPKPKPECSPKTAKCEGAKCVAR